MSADVPALEFRDLSVSYGDEPVIEGLSLAVERGITCGIIGPNGCGKSTLLKAAAGLLAPQRGSVLADGVNVYLLNATERARKVAFMPQDTAPSPMSVDELVAFGRYSYRSLLHGADAGERAAVDGAIAAARLEHLRNRPVSSLSGGQRQRAYIAMALVQQASCMLLDEPTSALDINAAHEMMGLIRTVSSVPGQTKLVVLHDIDLALRYCDRVVLMDGGRVLMADEPGAIAASGLLEQVFSVEVIRHETSRGTVWNFFPRA